MKNSFLILLMSFSLTLSSVCFAETESKSESQKSETSDSWLSFGLIGATATFITGALYTCLTSSNNAKIKKSTQTKHSNPEDIREIKKKMDHSNTLPSAIFSTFDDGCMLTLVPKLDQKEVIEEEQVVEQEQVAEQEQVVEQEQLQVAPAVVQQEQQLTRAQRAYLNHVNRIRNAQRLPQIRLF